MLTGKIPDPEQAWTFEAPTVLEPSVPSQISDVVVRAIELAPRQRFASAAEMRASLVAALNRAQACPK